MIKNSRISAATLSNDSIYRILKVFWFPRDEWSDALFIKLEALAFVRGCRNRTPEALYGFLPEVRRNRHHRRHNRPYADGCSWRIVRDDSKRYRIDQRTKEV